MVHPWRALDLGPANTGVGHVNMSRRVQAGLGGGARLLVSGRGRGYRQPPMAVPSIDVSRHSFGLGKTKRLKASKSIGEGVWRPYVKLPPDDSAAGTIPFRYS